MTPKPRKIEISWVQAAASALTAVTTAVLLSTVGVAGTIIGAAIGSVAATVGSAVYSHYLAASRDRVNAAAAARARVRRARTDLGEAAADPEGATPTTRDRLDHADRDLQKAGIELDTAGQASPWREAVRGLPWRRLALVAAALFVVTMAVIVAFELVAGRAVSTYTGGSDPDGPRVSVPGVGGGRSQEPEPTSPSPAATPSVVPSTSPTGTTAPLSPSATPSETATVPETPSSTAPVEPAPTSATPS